MDVIDNGAEQRFELNADGATAIAAYERDGQVLTFTHTVVPEELRGHGIGSRLIAGALAQVRARGERIVPQCPFVAAYVEEHATERELLAA